MGRWLQTKGLHIVLVILAALLATRCINWVAAKIARRLDRGHALVRSEAAKHRRAVASVISSVTIALLYVLVAVDIVDTLGLPVGSLIAPAAVLGAALGFGAQRMVQDLLSGFSSSPRSSTGSVTWFSSPPPGRPTTPVAPSRTSPCGSPSCAPATARCSPSPTARS